MKSCSMTILRKKDELEITKSHPRQMKVLGIAECTNQHRRAISSLSLSLNTEIPISASSYLFKGHHIN